VARQGVSEHSKAAHPGLVRSVLQFTGGFLLLVLIMLGVGGTIYKLISPEGWLAQLLGGSLNYLSAIAPFDWRDHHLIVFDHLVAPTAFYISRAEFETWWRDIGATDVNISWHNKNSWRGTGTIG